MCLQQGQGKYTIVTICGGYDGKVESKYILPCLLLKRNNANRGQHLYKFPRKATLHQNLLPAQLSHRSRASDQGIFLCEELQPRPLPGCIVQLPVGSTSVPINTPLTDTRIYLHSRIDKILKKESTKRFMIAPITCLCSGMDMMSRRYEASCPCLLTDVWSQHGAQRHQITPPK